MIRTCAICGRDTDLNAMRSATVGHDSRGRFLGGMTVSACAVCLDQDSDPTSRLREVRARRSCARHGHLNPSRCRVGVWLVPQ